jgi:CRP-like cAMP-binding protein
MDPRVAEAVGYLGALLVFLAFWTRDMVPLRVIAIASNLAFLVYGLVTAAMPVFLLHAALLPLNTLRLVENCRTLAASRAGRRDACLEALLRLMQPREVRAGEALFHRGQAATEWFYLVSGEIAIPEINLTCRAGEFVGTVGVFMPARRHANGAVALTTCRVLVLAADRADDMLKDHPEIALPLLRITIARLMRHPEVAAVARSAE